MCTNTTMMGLVRDIAHEGENSLARTPTLITTHDIETFALPFHGRLFKPHAIALPINQARKKSWIDGRIRGKVFPSDALIATWHARWIIVSPRQEFFQKKVTENTRKMNLKSLHIIHGDSFSKSLERNDTKKFFAYKCCTALRRTYDNDTNYQTLLELKLS